MIKTRVIAHRGASGRYVENTMDAFNKAVDAKADAIEFDVQLTADHQLVIFHDRDMKRLIGLEKGISDCTLKQLSNLQIEGHPIPTLVEVLDKFSGKVDLVLEIKPQQADPQYLLEQKVLDALDDSSGLGLGYLSVRSTDTYIYLEEASDYRIGLMQKKRTISKYHKVLSEYGIKIAQTRIQMYDNTHYDELHNLVDEINVFYADDPGLWKELVGYEVHGILTNYPRECRKYLDLL